MIHSSRILAGDWRKGDDPDGDKDDNFDDDDEDDVFPDDEEGDDGGSFDDDDDDDDDHDGDGFEETAQAGGWNRTMMRIGIIT